MSNRNIVPALTQADVNFNIHPNKAGAELIAPTMSSTQFMNQLKSFGLSDVKQIPVNFSWKDSNFLSPPLNQGHCGSCWAMSSTSSLADRFMIKEQRDGLVLNPLPTIICTDKECRRGGSSACTKGCAGGFPEHCKDFFATMGAVPNTPGQSYPTWEEYCEKQGNCCDEGCQKNPVSSPSMKCHLDKKGGFYTTENTPSLTVVDKNTDTIKINETIGNIKREIMENGPIVGKFAVYGDFIANHSGLLKSNGKEFNWGSTNNIYLHSSYDTELKKSLQHLAKSTPEGDPEKLKILQEGKMPVTTDSGHLYGAEPSKTLAGWHAVEIVGWGREELKNDHDHVNDHGHKNKYLDYWVVKNSWGNKWNGDGYYKFAINTNGKNNSECGFDIPIKTRAGFQGGTVAFNLDDQRKPPIWKGNKIDFSHKDKDKDKDKGGDTGFPIWAKILSIITVLVLIGLLVFIYIHHFKNKSSDYSQSKSMPSPVPSYSSMANKQQVTSNKTYSPTGYSPTYKIYSPIKYSITSK